MQCGTAGRVLPIKRSHTAPHQKGIVWTSSICKQRAIRSFQNIERGAFCSGVVKVHDQRRPDLLLHVQVPDLHVAQPEIRVNRVSIRGRLPAGGREPGRQSELSALHQRIGHGGRKRRLKCQILNDALIIADVVVDSVAGSHHRVVQRLPRDPHARCEIVAIGLDQAAGNALPGQHNRWRYRGIE